MHILKITTWLRFFYYYLIEVCNLQNHLHKETARYMFSITACYASVIYFLTELCYICIKSGL